MLLGEWLLVRAAASELSQASLQPVQPESDVMDPGFCMRGVGHVPGSVRRLNCSWVGDLAFQALSHKVASGSEMHAVF